MDLSLTTVSSSAAAAADDDKTQHYKTSTTADVVASHNKPAAVCASISLASNQVLVADDDAKIHIFSPDAEHIQDVHIRTLAHSGNQAQNPPSVHVTAVAWHPLAHPKKKEHDLFLLGLALERARVRDRLDLGTRPIGARLPSLARRQPRRGRGARASPQ